ncbi:SIS domain-containing protein [Luteococcus sanguinis]|uniref:SIS domain-containing protein n=1 Tax=Luteococcus sanguinis TaxID=174038 RepID=A0ABW1X032_9ACTN
MEFDDTRLDDPTALAGIDSHLRQLATAGARIRVAAGSTQLDGLADSELGRRPRGLIALGAEARLLRAVLEPQCPVPFVAWTIDGLPGWVGPLDTVVVLASEGSDPDLMSAVAEATRRGANLLVAAQPGSPIAEQAASRSTVLLPVPLADPLATVVVTLSALNRMGLGPQVHPEVVAERADMVAEECSPHRNLAENPAKDLAVALAEAQPLVWGGTVLAARAARRVAESLRRASGRPALAADASALLPVLRGASSRDLFADPADGLRPVLVVLDDGSDDERVRRERSELLALAERQQVRVCTVAATAAAGDVERYVELLQRGLFGAAYLGLGLVDEVAG